MNKKSRGRNSAPPSPPIKTTAYREADIPAAVDLVHTQLEVLKYIGGPKELVGSPDDYSGEGVSMDMVFLPDLVLDFRKDILEERKTRKGDPGNAVSASSRQEIHRQLDPVCAIGGRAARTACILAHLVDDADGIYRLHLIARTGNLGKLALENALLAQSPSASTRRHPAPPSDAPLQQKRTLNTQCVIVREGEPRWALRERSQANAVSTPQSRPQDELRAEDIEKGRPLELIRSARTVFLASMKNLDADRIAATIVAHLSTENAVLFLDGSRSLLSLDGGKPFAVSTDGSDDRAQGTPEHALDDESRSNLRRLSTILGGNNLHGKIGAVFLSRDEFDAIRRYVGPESVPDSHSTPGPSRASDTEVPGQAPTSSGSPSASKEREELRKELQSLLSLYSGSNVKRLERQTDIQPPLVLFGDILDESGDSQKRGLIELHVNGECKYTRHPQRVALGEEDAPERFKAGFMLASTVYRAVLALGEWCSKNAFTCPASVAKRNLIQYLVGQWKACNWMFTAIDYGLAMAAAGRDSGEFPQLADLAEAAGGSARRHAQGCWSFNGANVSVEYSRGASSRIHFRDSLVPECARLATQRRNGTLNCPDLSLCHEGEYKCGAACLHRKTGSAQRPAAAVLFDLDATLLASGEQRARGLAEALRELDANVQTAPAARPWHSDSEERVKAFEKYVYGYHDVYSSREMGFGDFRQVWNHEGWYVVYLIFLLKKLDPGPWTARIRTLHGAELDGQCALFRRYYETVLDQHRRAIVAAQRAFDRVAMDPLKEAHDLLESLRQTGGVGLYVVSEGDSETQWRKIERTGLHRYFDREHVLTTGDATFPEKYEHEFDKETELIKDNRKEVESNMGMLRDGIGMVVEYRLRRDAQCDMAPDGVTGERVDKDYDNIWHRIHKEFCAFYKTLVTLNNQLRSAEFAELVIQRLRKKRQVSVYAAAIRAILIAPHNPRGTLRDFIELVNTEAPPESRMKFAMVGDRVDNDISPVIDLLTHQRVVTIRLRCGSYARNTANDPPGVHPMFDCDTLAEAKALLLCRDTWDRVRCVEGVGLLGWHIDIRNPAHFPEDDHAQIGLDHLVNGIALDQTKYRLIHHICRGVLWEQLLLRTRADAYAILEHFVRPPEGGNRRGHYTQEQREYVIRALDEAGIRNHERFTRYSSSIDDLYAEGLRGTRT